MEELDIDIEQLFNNASKISATASTLETEFNDLDLRGNRWESAISTLQEQLRGVKNDVVRLDGTLDEAKSSTSALEAQEAQQDIKIAENKDASDKLKYGFGQIFYHIVENKNKIASAKEDMLNINSSMDDLTNQVTNSDKNIGLLENEITMLKMNIQKTVGQVMMPSIL